MKNVMREKIGKRDIMTFADTIEKNLLEANGDELSVITKAIGYPIKIAQKVGENGQVTPSIPNVSGLYAEPDLVDPNKKPEVKNKHIEVLAPNKQSVGCSLTYNYKTFFYRDPNNADQVNEIRIPEVDYTSLPDFFDFCINYFESMEDFKRYLYIILATNEHIVEQCWPGTGWELFEKLIGSTTSLGYTRKAYEEKRKMTPTEINASIKELEDKKKISLIELAHSALHNYRFIKGLKQVKKAYMNSISNRTLKDGSEVITEIQSSDITPIEVRKQNTGFTEVNGNLPSVNTKLNTFF